MNYETFFELMRVWQESEENAQLRRALEIHAFAERIYQQTIAAMYPIQIITTDNTRPIETKGAL